MLQWGRFKAHSGRMLDFKIECDSLTEEDWKGAAGMISLLVPPFSQVIGIPRGGLALQAALTEHIDEEANRLLIVDDVLTSGGSMEEERAFYAAQWPKSSIVGAVLFARGPCPYWITPVFTLNPGLQ